jgi:hypothetical protein
MRLWAIHHKIAQRSLVHGMGYFLASKIGGAAEFTATLFNSSFPKSTLPMSMATSNVPVFAAESRVIVPLVFLNSPRQTDKPPKMIGLEHRVGVIGVDVVSSWRREGNPGDGE